MRGKWEKKGGRDVKKDLPQGRSFWRCDGFGPELLGHEGQQRDLTGALDGLGQLTLVHGAGAGGAAGQDLGARK